jgi:hypothetical protein
MRFFRILFEIIELLAMAPPAGFRSHVAIDLFLRLDRSAQEDQEAIKEQAQQGPMDSSFNYRIKHLFPPWQDSYALKPENLSLISDDPIFWCSFNCLSSFGRQY